MDRIGQLFGNYKLIRLLGQGGFSDVYLGEQIHLGTFAAIKILRTQLAEDNVENFRIEARTLAHLKHPNIVQVLDFGVADMMPYLIMHYASNGTLRRRHPRGVPVSLNVVVSYVKQTASALQYAHNQKLIHRDIKPENLLVGDQNEILLSDFGIAVVTASARAADPALDAGSWNPAGTVSYMAPEQIQGKTVTASDQYALAIVVYEWLTGVLPFKGQYMEVVVQHMSTAPASLRDKVPSLSPQVEQVVLTALNKDPQRRFARIEAFSNALEQASQIDLSPSVSAPVASYVTGIPRSTHTSEVPTMEVALIGALGRIVLGITKVTIGRAPDSTLVLGDSNVSSHHAEIRPEGQYFSLVDLNSTNGTFVNEQQVNHSAPHLLQHGDIIRVGNTKFTFEVSNVPQSYSDGLTKRAAPPVDNTNYGMGILNAGGQQSYTPPPPPPPQVSETQVPTYISLPYGQSGQPQYTPPQLQAQQPQYTPPQLPSPISNLPPTQKQKRSLGRTVILGVIALVIILASIAGFFIYHNNQVALNNTNMTATAQTQANNTTTAQNNLTAIARVNATATFVTNPYPPNSGSLTLFDPLKDNSKGHRWDEGTTGASSCKFTGGTFHVTSGSKNVLNSCFANTTNFSDFAYQIELTIVKGDCGGLIFRADSTNSKFYSFELCQDGTYSVLLFSSNSSSKYLLKLTTNAAIKTGLNQANVIAAIANAGTIQLYVNNISVDSVTDTTLRQGEIGLLADDYTNVTDVAFDNAKVWTL